MKKLVFTVFISLISLSAHATQVCNSTDLTDCLNFEKKLAEIKEIPGISETKMNSLIILSDHKNRVLYLFSTEISQVYPTYVEQKVIEKDGNPNVQTTAYTAAAKNAFDPWFAQYKQVGERANYQASREPVK